MSPDPAEQQRLAALARLTAGMPGHLPELDDLARAAAAVAGCRTGLVDLVGEAHASFPGRAGTALRTAPRSLVPCDAVVRDALPLVVPDLSADPAWSGSPVVREQGARFYAGFPLVASDGAVLGALCVLDTVPHEGLTDVAATVLSTLAAQVVAQLELRAALVEGERTQAALAASERRFRGLAEASPDILSRHAPDGSVRYVSPSFDAVLGGGRKVDGTSRAGRVHEDDRPAFLAALRAVQHGRPTTVTHRAERADGGAVWLETCLTPVLDGNGVLTEIHSTARDVSARVEAEQARDRARAEAEELQVALRGALEELTQRQVLVDAVLGTVGVGILACDASGRITLVNAAASDLHGLPASAALDGRAWAGWYDLFAEDGRTPLSRDQVPLLRALREGVVEDVVVSIAPHGLPQRTVTCSGRALHGPDGRLLGAVLAMTDVTALRASERRFRAAFYDSPTPMAHVDAEGVVRDANPALRRFLAVSGRRLLGMPLALHAHPVDRELLVDALHGPGTGARPAEVRMLRADGSPVWCELATTRSSDGAGGEHVLAQLLDVHGRKENERALETAARRDPLTGLGNRHVLTTHLDAMVDALGGSGGAVLLLDLDGFKGVNDTLGHEAGDAVLVEVARRLVATVRPHDVVVRLGGDEFVVLCRADRTGALPDADELASRLESALGEPFAWEGHVLPLGGSVGWALARPGDEAEDRLDAADRAMYGRKRARRAAVRLPA